ncbi:MAG: hypothetical protein Q8N05_16675 [Bacteroidota bacterium]|nr:hypothetical protein [Bacteroidota bacterium]
MEDYRRDRIKDISRMDVARLVDDLVMELHMDCSKKVDPEVFKHTTNKFTNLLTGKFASWHWGEVLSITKLGIAGSYGSYSDKINFQALFSWMRKAQQSRSSNFAEKSIQEAKDISNESKGNFRNNSSRWKQFHEYMEGERLWFLDNITLQNCEQFHTCNSASALNEFRRSMIQEPDPVYYERMKNMTLEQFKKEANVFD